MNLSLGPGNASFINSSTLYSKPSSTSLLASQVQSLMDLDMETTDQTPTLNQLLRAFNSANSSSFAADGNNTTTPNVLNTQNISALLTLADFNEEDLSTRTYYSNMSIANANILSPFGTSTTSLTRREQSQEEEEGTGEEGALEEQGNDGTKLDETDMAMTRIYGSGILDQVGGKETDDITNADSQDGMEMTRTYGKDILVHHLSIHLSRILNIEY